MTWDCELCDLSFRSLAERNTHVSASRNHPLCGSCNRRFLHSQAKRDHCRAAARHFYCEGCDRSFVDAQALHQHNTYSLRHSGGMTSTFPTYSGATGRSTLSDSSDNEDDGEYDPSELWASEPGSESSLERESRAIVNALSLMSISPAMRQEIVQGRPVWAGDRSAGVESHDDTSSEDESDDEVEGYNSEDFDSSDSEDDFFDRRTRDAREAQSNSSSSSTLNSEGPGGVKKSGKDVAEDNAKKASPNALIVYTCPLCMDEGNTDLSSLACGHVFCSSCSKRSLHHKRQCPLCRQPARMRDVRRIYLTC